MRISTRAARVFDAPDVPPHVEQTPEGTRVTMRIPVDSAAAQMVGHYPGFPIMPGVLVIDAVRQAAGATSTTALRLCGIGRARFTRPLLPGDELRLTVLVTAGAGDRVEASAWGVRADGQTAAELTVTLEPVVPDA